ncbi:hypothetical protein [Glutamicibacter creatinolyticus]
MLLHQLIEQIHQAIKGVMVCAHQGQEPDLLTFGRHSSGPISVAPG